MDERTADENSAGRLKLAGADFSFLLLAHEDCLDLIARLGFEGVDIGLFPGRSHSQPTDYLDDIAGAARELGARVRDRGLEFADIFLQNALRLVAFNQHPPEGRYLKCIFARV